jgi:hypothetical protein
MLRIGHHEFPRSVEVDLRIRASAANRDQSKRLLIGVRIVAFDGIVEHTGDECADASTLRSRPILDAGCWIQSKLLIDPSTPPAAPVGMTA